MKKHAPIDEAALLDIICAGLAARLGEDYIDPSAVHIEDFGVVSVGDETMRVHATVDVYVQDGISGGVTVELARWEPAQGRVIRFDD